MKSLLSFLSSYLSIEEVPSNQEGKTYIPMGKGHE